MLRFLFLCLRDNYIYGIIDGRYCEVKLMTTLTKDAIKKSFMKLLNRKPLNKITVKEIVEDCGINRNSFYYHYSDIPALVEEIFNEQADQLVQLTDDASIYESFVIAMNFSLQNKSAMMHIYNSANKELFDRYLNRVAQRTVTEYIEHNAVPYNITPEDKEAVVFYYKSLIVGFVVEWLSDGMKYDLTEKLARVCEIFDGTLESVMAKCEREAENK